MQNFQSDIKGTKSLADSFPEWGGPCKLIAGTSVLQKVKKNKEERAATLKMDIDSQYRLLLFLKKVV